MNLPNTSTFNIFFPKGDEFIINHFEERTIENCDFHSHEFVELCYVHLGSGYHIVGDKEFKVKKGDFFIVNHDIPHVFYKDQNHALTTYNIMFKPGFFDNMLLNFSDFDSLSLSYLFRNICDDDYARQDLRLNPDEQKEFESVVDNIYLEFTSKREGYINSIRGYMIVLIIMIMRFIKTRTITDSKSHPNISVISNVLSYLKENYSHNVNLNSLALKSFYSKNYLCNIFKEATGMTITQYIQNLRITEACKLLDSTDIKITDLASQVGFSDYKTFHSTFKKIIGVLPKDYRKK